MLINDNGRYLVKVATLLSLVLFAKSCETVDDYRTSIGDEKPQLLLISLDGFRYNYFEFTKTPTFDSLIAIGATAESLIPVFPTKTFPNHYSQVTGLHPASHGIISNHMYDPEFDEYFTIGTSSTNTSESKWYQGEPIWVTGKRQGLVSATMFWPGSEAAINGVHPNYYFPYNHSASVENRIDQVLEWMSLNQGRPDLVTLYLEQIDRVGHLHGPNGKKLKPKIEALDAQLGVLFRKIGALGLADHLNVVIVSDHGMHQLNRSKVIFLDDYIDLDQVEVVNWSPVAEIIPKDGAQDLIYEQLLDVHDKFQVYKKISIPQKWHYSQHRRITPIVAVAAAGWSITSRQYFDDHPRAFTGGTHGYAPEVKSMHGIFLAAGPSFKSDVKIGSVETIHLYELLCSLLSITPAKNEGRFEVWEQILN